MTNFQLSVYFFFQVAFIIAVCRVMGLLARRAGQPQVVAEMVTGVLLGPSLFGWLFPGLQALIFPQASMTILYIVAHLGLVLYMFLVGAEFQEQLIRKQLSRAASVSLAGICVPFALGGLLALYLAKGTTFFTQGVGTWQAALFIGACMSVTAFPVLARIIYDCGLTGTSLGTLALAAGSADDAAAWCVLAIVLASLGGDPTVAVLAIGGGLAYAVTMLTLGRRLLGRLGNRVERDGALSGENLALVLMLLMLCAWLTDAIQIYAVFGAFILGIVMPRGLLTRELRRMLEPLTKTLLVPLFFVYSGLNTSIRLVDSWYLLGMALLVLLVACLGKGVACYMAARYHGESHRESMAIGTLMNARGLMELIMLNIGLEKGIITPTLFTIMVIMTIVTTLAATPLFNWVYVREPEPSRPAADATTALIANT